jgi:hypothetical protein
LDFHAALLRLAQSVACGGKGQSALMPDDDRGWLYAVQEQLSLHSLHVASLAAQSNGMARANRIGRVADNLLGRRRKTILVQKDEVVGALGVGQRRNILSDNCRRCKEKTASEGGRKRQVLHCFPSS